ncbi:ABC transporter ATP-binding protein [Neobacillus sp. SAB-20_R2A]|uniref:ABC transporter ATP-binding protein n=1 Tax=Neobacillus sp. SAB-20_R2A TaxID=3120519 RepID=UPI003C6E19ED
MIVKNVSKTFGGIAAISNVSMRLENEILGIIGPNGAGKTTLLNLISGLISPDDGEIYWKNINIAKYKIDAVSRLGLVRTFQHVKVFPSLTVLENILISIYARDIGSKMSPLKAFGGKYKKAALAEAEDLLGMANMNQYSDQTAGALPYGLGKRLGILLGLSTKPEAILLDEPATGLNNEEIKDLDRLLRNTFKDKKIAIGLIEHNMNFLMNLAHRVIVLNEGEVIANGSPAEVQKDEKVIQAYFGTGRNEVELF